MFVKQISMTLIVVLFMGHSASAVLAQDKIHRIIVSSAAAVLPKFEIRIQFDPSAVPPCEVRTQIAIGQRITQKISCPGTPGGVGPSFNTIIISLFAAKQGAYTVILTPANRGVAYFDLDGTSHLTLTPNKPYSWRVYPAGSTHYVVTLISAKQS